MATIPTRRISSHADDYFFLSSVLAVIVIVFVGFAPTYYLAPVLHAPALPSVIVHLHGAVFTGWILLLLVQVLLVLAGRRSWHMKLGIFGLVLAPLMVILGFATLIAALRRQFLPPSVGEEVFAYDAFHLSFFAAMVLWGFLVRSNGPAHKRLMLIATFSILGPALARWPYPALTSNNFYFSSVLDLFLVFMLGFDIWSRRRPHLTTMLGLFSIVAMQMAFVPMAQTAAWHRLMTLVRSF